MEEKNKKNTPFLLILILVLLSVGIGYLIGQSVHKSPQSANQTVSFSDNTTNGSNSTASQVSNNTANSKNTKWVCLDYDKNNKCTLEYDKDDIQQVYGSVFKVWTNWYGEKVKNTEIELGVRDGLPVKAFDNFSHTTVLYYIDCDNQTYKIISSADYDTDGNVINSHDNQGDSYSPIVPDTLGDALYKAVCNKQ
ncbi:surface-adhesin E family protein [Desulfurella sp.]|uniref:surface-adhesin E family protein n=1 Tax=Desulfurella sp. TaxID=1962857 RepID=UPI0025BBD2BA|nr:surface-adhesin E family protein [Desulfurella sp.]